MTEEDLKVTDKRMFTPDGELREEFRHLETADEAPEASRADSETTPPEPSVESETRSDAATGPSGPILGTAPTPGPAAAPSGSQAGGPGVSPPAGGSGADETRAGAERPGETGPTQPPASGELSILDLVGLLAEHTALYLGEASLPDGKSVRDLRAAKLHLDLLDVLKAKTAGNLTGDEQAVLDDILYRLRMLYVEKMRQE